MRSMTRTNFLPQRLQATNYSEAGHKLTNQNRLMEISTVKYIGYASNHVEMQNNGEICCTRLNNRSEVLKVVHLDENDLRA